MPTERNKKNTNKLYGEMPHSIEAEKAILGCMMLDAEVQSEVSASLSDEDFYSEKNKKIFYAMEELIKLNQPVELVTLTDMLTKNGVLESEVGITDLTDLTDGIPSTANYKNYFDIVKRESILRKLIKASNDITEDCLESTDKDGSLAFAEKAIFDISQTADTSDMVKISSVIPEVMSNIDKLANDRNSLRGIRTGFREFDNLLDGLHKSDLMILAARPAMGKTSFAMNLVENVARAGYSCAVFSLEMSKEQLVTRLLCSCAGVSMEHVSKGQMTKEEWLKIAKAREILSKCKIMIDESSMIKPKEILSKCRRLKKKEGLDFIVIDYIQLMTPDNSKKSDSRQNEVSDISRNLKILAKEINVPVLALSQLSRDVEKRKGRPQLSDLRESGAIEQDADIVFFIHRPDKVQDEKGLDESKVRKNVAEILVEKHRNGPTGVAKLYFMGECTKFLNINETTGEPEGDVKPSSSNKAEPTEKDIPTSQEEKDVDDEIYGN